MQLVRAASGGWPPPEEILDPAGIRCREFFLLFFTTCYQIKSIPKCDHQISLFITPTPPKYAPT